MIESLVRRELAITLGGLAVLVALAWLSLPHVGGGPGEMAGMAAASPAPWTARDAALATLMWLVMMVAMMVPAAAPMILMFSAVNRRRTTAGGPPAVSTALFVLSYLLVWSGFSVVAALAQWGLRAAALLSPHTLVVTPLAGSALLAAAGVYQFTPLKYACLARCRTPLAFVLTEWREGKRGALVMGLRHGRYCLGCCWVLMGLIFVGGVMNLAWIGALTVFVLVEKVLPGGRLASWAAGGVLLGWAAWAARAAL